MSPGATTPSACTCTSACATSTARCAPATACARCCRCCWRSRPTPRSSTGATAACTRRARRASPRAFRAAACPTRSAAGRRTASTSSSCRGTSSIVEFTQVWWSVRPHFSFGTVEVRICDAQASAQESEALAGLMVACIAQAVRDVDEQVPFADPAPRLIEENMWRAIRFGLDGRLIDLERRMRVPGARSDRAAARLDRARARGAGDRACVPRAQRRAAPAPDDRGGRRARGGVRGQRAARHRTSYSEEVAV